MVTEVNRLIANLFAAGEPIAFPQVGTLTPVKRPARRLSKRELLPPTREIDFASAVQGATLAQRLAQAANCSLEQAEEIYGRWLGYTFNEGGLTLEGIGVLRNKHFTLDPAFDARLNPQGRKAIPIKVRRRAFDWTIALGVVAIIAAIGIGYYGYTELKGSVRMPWQQEQTADNQTIKITTSTIAKTTTPTDSTTTTQPVEPIETVAKAVPEQPKVTAVTANRQPVASPSQPHESGSIRTMVSGAYYVVLGVFSTPENAERAANEAFMKQAMPCQVYRFGQKWMVSPFTSADAAACTQFRRTHLETHPDLWVYQAR